MYFIVLCFLRSLLMQSRYILLRLLKFHFYFNEAMIDKRRIIVYCILMHLKFFLFIQ